MLNSTKQMQHMKTGRPAWGAERFLWTRDDVLAEVVFHTGVVVWAFSTIDYSLSDIAFRASHHPSYADIRSNYPNSVEGRITYLKEALKRPGPLLPYRFLGGRFLERFRELRDLRHMMAHSRLSPVLDHFVQYERINRQPSGEVVHEYKKMPLDDLQQTAERAAGLSRACRRLYWRIGEMGLLPRVDAMTTPPHPA